MADPNESQLADREMKSRFLYLSVEAYRQELISRGKLRDLAKLAAVPFENLVGLLEDEQAVD